MTTETKQTQKKASGIPVAIGVAGAVVGAGVGAAAAVLLNDKDNREKAKQVLTNVKDKALNYAEDVTDDVKKNPQVKEAAKAVEEKKKEVAARLK